MVNLYDIILSYISINIYTSFHLPPSLFTTFYLFLPLSTVFHLLPPLSTLLHLSPPHSTSFASLYYPLNLSHLFFIYPSSSYLFTSPYIFLIFVLFCFLLPRSLFPSLSVISSSSLASPSLPFFSPFSFSSPPLSSLPTP